MGRYTLFACLSLAWVGCFTSHELNSGVEGDSPSDTPLEPLTYYRDVKPIFDAKCSQCHAPGGIGPLSLTTYAEVKPFADVIRRDVAEGVMPPWRASGELDVFVGDRRLSEAQRNMITRWIDEGAVAGDPADEPDPAPSEPRGLERIDTSINLPERYTPKEEPDNYRCFVLEWPHEGTKYLTGLSIEPEATQMVHHAIVYLVQPENAQAERDKDAAEEGPGYDCFGVTSGLSTWLTSYEPGGYGQAVPGNAGFEIRPGSVLVLQIHYNTLAGKTSDLTRLDLTVEDQVERVGNVSLIMNPLWLAGFMQIPANQPDVMHTWTGRPLGLGSQEYDIYWVDLHMHTLGTSGKIGIVRAGQSEREMLLDIPDWAFEWQETYRMREPVKLHPGDQLFVECHFDNTAENQNVVNGERLEPRNVTWGEATTDEMCLGNVLLTPSMD